MPLSFGETLRAVNPDLYEQWAATQGGALNSPDDVKALEAAGNSMDVFSPQYALRPVTSPPEAERRGGTSAPVPTPTQSPQPETPAPMPDRGRRPVMPSPPPSNVAGPAPRPGAATPTSRDAGSFDIGGALSAGYSPSELADYLAQNPDVSPIDVAGARKAGYGDDEIISHVTPKPSPATRAAGWVYDHLPGSVQRGIAHAADSTANTAEVFGAPETADAIRSRIDQKALHAPSSTAAVTQAFRDGRYGAALGNLPGAVGEAVPQLVGTLASGMGGAAIGSAIGPEGTAAGAIGGLAGPALMGVVTQAGDIAKARAAADGRSTVNDADIAAAVGSSAVLGALGRIGLGDAAGGMVANVLRRGVGSAAANATGSVIAHAGADAAAAAGQGLATTAGTAQGATVDPAQVATMAAVGAGTRAGLGAARTIGSAVDATRPANRAAALRSEWAAMSPEDQAGVTDAAAAGRTVQAVQDGAVSTSGARPAVAARTASRDLAGQVQETTRSLVDRGVIDPEAAGTIGAALASARSPREALTAGHLSAVEGLGLDAQTTGALTGALRQINTLSDPAASGQGQGPFARFGGALGGSAGYLAGGGHFVAGLPMSEMAGSLGSALGSKVDSLIGLNQPALLREGRRAAAMLEASGVRVPDTRADLMAAIKDQRSAIQAQAEMMGLSADRYGPTAPERAADARTAAADYLASQPPNAGPQAPAATQEAVEQQSALRAAAARAASRPATEPAKTLVAPATALSAPMPGTEGFSAEAMAHGQLLPDWQYGLGKNLTDELHTAGDPKKLNYAQEVGQAVRALQSRGYFDPAFSTALMSHGGRVTRGLYNLIRNEMLMNHGIDRRTLDGQQPRPD